LTAHSSLSLVRVKCVEPSAGWLRAEGKCHDSLMRRLWVAGWLPAIAAVAGVLGLLWLVLVAAPPWFVHDRSLEGLKAQNEVRTTLLQGLGGVVLLVGAYFTYRQLRTTREGQITERYTRAIDQLGHAQLDVRLGGIYALERIARDSPADRATIGEVLTAFVRSHAPWPPRLSGQYVAAAPIDQVPELQVRAPDVQASLTVLGRSGFARAGGDQGNRLDLHAGDLRCARLRGAQLERANLHDAHLDRANLGGANLERTDLGRAQLEGANLFGAQLKEAYLGGAQLKGAILAGAHLEGAILTDANLKGAILAGAHLEGAHLGGANLKGVYLGGAQMEGANLKNARLEGANLSVGEWAWTDTTSGFWEWVDLAEELWEAWSAHLGAANLKGANLRGARLEGANLEGAVADERTGWPDAFDWRAAGVSVTGEDANSP
jgi:Pentapeptide repeats (8 copies)